MCVCVRELNGEQRRRRLNNESIVVVNQGMHNLSLRCENTCVKKNSGDQDFEP